MTSPADNEPRLFTAAIASSGLLLLAFVLLVVGRLGLPFLEPEEALYAEIPREMLGTGSFVVPVLHGQPYLDKPPLLYWSVMGSYLLFGVHVWAARLVPAVAAWLTVVAVFGWGRACGGWRSGWVAAAVLTLLGDFSYRGPMLTPNGMLGLLTTLGLAWGHLAVRQGRLRRGCWLASAVAVGLALLAKGPIGAVLVVGPLFLVPRLVAPLARPSTFAWLGYFFVVLVIACPWFVMVSIREPTFAEYFFWKHHVLRFTEPFDHAKPVYYYLPQLLLGGLPWTLSLLTKFRRRDLSADARFAILAVAWGFLFFSLSGSKRPVYLVPLWPMLAFGVGAFLTAKRAWWWAGGVTAVVVSIGVFAWLPSYHQRFSLAAAAEVVADRDAGVPVYCYPHSWNSLDFYLDDRLPSLRVSDLPSLMQQLKSHDRAMIVVPNGIEVGPLPGDWIITSRRECGLVTVLSIQHREPLP